MSRSMTRNRMRELLTLDERSEEEASVILVMLVCGCGLKLLVQSEIASRTRRSSCRSSNPAVDPRDGSGRSLIP